MGQHAIGWLSWPDESAFIVTVPMGQQALIHQHLAAVDLALSCRPAANEQAKRLPGDTGS